MLTHEQNLDQAESEAQRLLDKTHRRVWICSGCGEEVKKNENIGPCRKCGAIRYDHIWKPKKHSRLRKQQLCKKRKGTT